MSNQETQNEAPKEPQPQQEVRAPVASPAPPVVQTVGVPWGALGPGTRIV
jgi:hypothetical protein